MSLLHFRTKPVNFKIFFCWDLYQLFYRADVSKLCRSAPSHPVKCPVIVAWYYTHILTLLKELHGTLYLMKNYLKF